MMRHWKIGMMEYWNQFRVPARCAPIVTFFCALGLAFFLLTGLGCGARHELARSQWFTMGTVAAIQAQTMEEAKSGRERVQPLFDSVDSRFSTWLETSEVSALNGTSGTTVPNLLSPEVETVLLAALQLSEQSDGAFSPLIGPLMETWGFGKEGAPPAVPTPDQLQRAIIISDWRALCFSTNSKPATLALPRKGMKLDLGAIAKGYAVDLAFERLQQEGCTNILIDLGGNLRALGEASPGRDGWRTGIRNPFAEGKCLAQFLLRPGEAVATSGNYERFVEIDHVRYAHIMDARTGKPVTGIAGVTVVAPTAMLADGLSTTLFVLGPEAGLKLLERYPKCEAVWITDTPESPEIICTPGITQRLSPVGKKELIVRSL